MNKTLCNNCAGTIILSLNEHHEQNNLIFCSEECADTFFERLKEDPQNPENIPVGLLYDLGQDGK